MNICYGLINYVIDCAGGMLNHETVRYKILTTPYYLLITLKLKKTHTTISKAYTEERLILLLYCVFTVLWVLFSFKYLPHEVFAAPIRKLST